MKRTSILVATLATLLLSCSKSEVTAPTTSLQISVIDELGSPVSGATVKLYDSEINYTNATNQVQYTQTSDAKGIVYFDNLSPIKYYISAVKDCQTNRFGGVVTNSLVQNIQSNVTAVLSKGGVLSINNTSSNPYDIYINGVLNISNMAGGTSKLLAAKIGTYNIRVLQKSGYVLSPTDKTYTGTMSCGTILNVTFP